MPLPAPTGRFEAWIDLSWRGLGSRKDVAHRRLLIATTFALILMIGVVDYITGYEFSLQVFYLMPICLAVATAGWRFGVEASVASTAMWLARDLAAGAHFAGPVVSVWNALIALSTYLMVVWLLSSLITVHGEMENRVSQRTSASRSPSSRSASARGSPSPSRNSRQPHRSIFMWFAYAAATERWSWRPMARRRTSTGLPRRPFATARATGTRSGSRSPWRAGRAASRSAYATTGSGFPPRGCAGRAWGCGS